MAHGDRISEILLRSGDIAAEGARRSGQIWGNAIQDVGQVASGAVQQYALKKRDAAIAQTIETWDGKDPKQLYMDLTKVGGPDMGAKIAEGVLSFHALGQKDPKAELEHFNRTLKGAAALPDSVLARAWPAMHTKLAPAAERFLGIPAAEIPQEFTPELGETLRALARGDAQPKTREVRTRAADGSEKVQIVEDKPGFETTSAAEKPMPSFQSKDVLLDGKTAMVNFDSRTGKYFLDGQDVSARVRPVPPQGPSGGEPLEAVIDPATNKAVLLPRSQARGMQPASSREQGRPVISGDANKISDMVNSLNDINALTGSLSGSKATGVVAKAGAMLPNFVTEWTGVGADAKKKQALIDRVKQVIGKTLEEGVLRKEDEVKYEKILPTIGDVPDVVQAKLDGLWDAVILKRQTLIDSLSDAGYDTSRFEQRPVPERRGAPGDGDKDKRIVVNSPDELRKLNLKRGTVFYTPDGQRRAVR